VYRRRFLHHLFSAVFIALNLGVLFCEPRKNASFLRIRRREGNKKFEKSKYDGMARSLN
jgi:hypothetical protein